MLILLRNRLKPSFITSCLSTAPRSRHLPAMTPILKSDLTEKNPTMRSISILLNQVFPTFLAPNTSKGALAYLTCDNGRIDARYLNGSTPAAAYRLETFRSMGSISQSSKKQIRCYFVTKCEFVNPNPTLEEMRDLRVCGDKHFLEKVTENTLDIYQSVVDAVLERSGMYKCGITLIVGPVIEMFELEGTRERRLVIGYRQLTSTNFFSALSDLYHFYGLTSSRKYVEQFSNGITVIGIYLLPTRNQSKFPPIESSIFQVCNKIFFVNVRLSRKHRYCTVSLNRSSSN